MGATRLIANVLCVSIALAPACGDDSSATGAEGTGGSAEEAIPATHDDVTQALVASGPLGMQMVDIVVRGPLALDAGSRDASFICGSTDEGSCPSKTVECQAAKVTKVTLAFKEADKCKDGSGAPLKGTLVFNRNDARDWTVVFQSLDRNGVVLNGEARFQSDVGQPWSVTLNLKLTGAASGSKDDSS
ncbi:MAG: hypothetical protein MUF54_04900, partial [Polyangiaceae bacterium]|nr:hypothetical protein [Polyangiaceae bacterium]